jgi:UDP-glucose 4-epimerase
VTVEPYRGRKVVITGGMGFIGSSLARALVRLGANVTLIDSLIPEYGGNPANVDDIRDRVTINISDVRDPHALRYLMRGQDYLFNLAGQTSHVDSMRDPFTDLEINCRSQLSILEVCRNENPGIRVLFASTRQVYGKPQYLPVDERHPLKPVDVNGINKLAGEWYHVLYDEVYSLRCSCLRLTNTYGPGMRVRDARQTFLGIWIRRILEGELFQVFGDGLQLRDFNYVDDVVDAMLRVAATEETRGRIYNLGGDERINLKTLAELLVQCNGGKGRFEVVPFPPERKRIDIGDYYGEFSAITEAVGWRPSTCLREGVTRTLDFFREALPRYV